MSSNVSVMYCDHCVCLQNIKGRYFLNLLFDNSRLEKIDPKGCPPPGRKSHPLMKLAVDEKIHKSFVVDLVGAHHSPSVRFIVTGHYKLVS